MVVRTCSPRTRRGQVNGKRRSMNHRNQRQNRQETQCFSHNNPFHIGFRIRIANAKDETFSVQKIIRSLAFQFIMYVMR